MVVRRSLVALLAVAGASVLLYPSAGNWFSDRAHAAEVSGYTETVDSLPAGERSEILDRAHDYNRSLATDRIEDPYGLAAATAAAAAPAAESEQESGGPETTETTDASGDPAAADPAAPDPAAPDQTAPDQTATGQTATGQTATGPADSASPSAGTRLGYLDQLRLGTSDTMARLRIPTIGASLPVFHGTSDETLERGVGHLQGSALPVGGAGTNSVLTGHSGIPQSRLFTDLHDLVVGDVVTVEVVGETLTYQVDRIATVLPTETDLLQPVPGADLLTLVTCTPIGVNTHRLLVQAHRVDEAALPAAVVVAGAAGAGFPWWGLVWSGALTWGLWFAVRPAALTRAGAVGRHRMPGRRGRGGGAARA